MPPAVVWLDDRVVGEKGLGPGGDRGALGVNQAGTIVTVFSGSSVVSTTRATSVVIPLRNRVDAFRSPVRHPSAPRSPPNRFPVAAGVQTLVGVDAVALNQPAMWEYTPVTPSGYWFQQAC